MNKTLKVYLAFYIFSIISSVACAQSKLDDYYIDDIKATKINFLNFFNKCTFVILYTNYSCQDCLKKLVFELDGICDKTENLDYCILVRCDNHILSRKDIHQKLISIKKDIKIYFDIHESTDEWPPMNFSDGIFSLYKISYTPCLFFMDNDKKTKFIDFKNLFNNNLININLQNLISDVKCK